MEPLVSERYGHGAPGPVVNSVTSILTTAAQTFAASALFIASDPFGDAIEQYDFWDTGAGGGRFMLNGQA